MGWMQRIFTRPKVSTALSRWEEGQKVDVERFWAEAWVELRARQQGLSKGMRLAEATWSVNQDAGLIEFERRDGVLVRAPVQIIGAWNPKTELFTWGWDHPSVQARLRRDAERTRWFGDAHGLKELTENKVRVSEAEAWRLTAVAVKVNGANAAYRGPTDGPVVFMSLGEAKVLEDFKGPGEAPHK